MVEHRELVGLVRLGGLSYIGRRYESAHIYVLGCIYVRFDHFDHGGRGAK